MARNKTEVAAKKKAPPEKKNFACPNCKSTEGLDYTESLLCSYHVDITEGLATVEFEEGEVDWGGGEGLNEPFTCKSCFHTFKAGDMRVKYE